MRSRWIGLLVSAWLAGAYAGAIGVQNTHQNSNRALERIARALEAMQRNCE